MSILALTGQIIGGLGVLASCAYLIMNCGVVYVFKREQEQARNLIEADCGGIKYAGECPPVTQIKPLRTYPNSDEWQALQSFAAQDYPSLNQVILAVDSEEAASGGDGASNLRTLAPNAEVSIGSVEAMNKKIGVCLPALERAQGGIIAISDADMVASPRLLRCLSLALQDKNTGLATCLYTVKHMPTFGALCEGLSVNDFGVSVLVARLVEGINFALGAVMALNRSTLKAIGGLEAIKDHLADDYQLGLRTSQLGKKVVLAAEVVEDVVGPLTFKEYFIHQLRWMRTYKASRPGGFFAFIITQGLLWSSLLLLSSGAESWCLLLASLWLLLRWGETFYSWNVLAGSNKVGRYAFLAPIKDFFYLVLWFGAFLGDNVEWGGVRYSIDKEGKMRQSR